MASPQKENKPELTAAPAAAKKAPVIALNQTRIKEASYMRNEWFVTCPAGTKHEDLLDPEFWRNVGQNFKPFDMIEAVTEDGNWYTRLIVVSADRLWAKVHIVSFSDLIEARKNMPKTDDENHGVEWKGPIAKFAVVRKSDAAILKDGFTTQLEGWTWLDGHLKSLKN